MQDVYSEEMGLRNRRIWHRNDIGVIRWANCPAILIETAFIDSPLTNPDVEILRNRRNEIAQAIAEGLFDYLDINATAQPAPAPVLDRYNQIDELPSWARPTIEKLVRKGHLSGDGTGLNLSMDMVRIFVIHDRAGLF